MNSNQIGLFGLVGAVGALGARVIGGLNDKKDSRSIIVVCIISCLIAYAVLGFAGTYIIGIILGIIVLDFGIQGNQGRKAEILLANDLTELLQTQQSLQEAYKNIVDIEEQERQRLAGEIHDGIAQNLVAMQLMFTGISMSVPAIQQHPHAGIFSETLDATINECKEIVGNVRPKELIDNGLDAMLENLLQKINSIGKLNITLQLNTSLDSCFEYNERFHLYRIIQENISNTLKYAAATTATVAASRTDHSVEISFTDNGKGIPEKAMLAESSFIGIKRRLAVLNASFEVLNLAEGGARFKYSIPVSSSTGTTVN